MNSKITVVSLGPGDPQWLTIQTVKALQNAKKLVLRTDHHQVVQWLTEQGIGFSSLDDCYQTCDNFEDAYHHMAEILWNQAEHQEIVYAVADAVTDASVAQLRLLRPQNAVLECIPGISTSDICAAYSHNVIDIADGWKVIPATHLEQMTLDPTIPLLVTEIDQQLLSGIVKAILTDLYEDDIMVVFFPSIAEGTSKPIMIPLYELDRQKHYDHTVCTLIPPQSLMGRKRYCFEDLLQIMEILRGQNGCPWDREQTHATLRKYLLEEAYEAVDAIDAEDDEHLADELGDVLLQIVFHASIAQSQGSFHITDVTSAICRKMIYRHEHIFGKRICNTPGEVSTQWEELKRAERGFQTQADVLNAVSHALPALIRTQKVQEKALPQLHSRLSYEYVLNQIKELLLTLESSTSNPAIDQPHIGKLLFLSVQLASAVQCDSEESLSKETDKFIRLFTEMEKSIIRDGKSLKDLTLREMDVYWNQVKEATSFALSDDRDSHGVGH